ncbi:MAG: HAD family hydrolase [Candidatus Saccharibacteria bacterium]|nr:HAD family hydrolase [Candidatus Saccharibacteria bacterium]
MIFTKIIFSDFDNTMFEHSSPDDTAKNLTAIKRWREAGNLFVITTGRGEESLRAIMPNYEEYADYCVLCDGNMINYPSGTLYNISSFGEELAKKLNDTFANCNFAHGRAMICFEPGSEKSRVTADTCKVRLWFTSALDCTMSERILMERFGDELEFLTYYYASFNDDIRLDWIEPTMFHIIEVTKRGINKSAGIRELLSRLGIHNPNRIITIGDGKNDIGMVEDFNGYAVGHAAPELYERVPEDKIVRHLHELIAKKLSP